MVVPAKLNAPEGSIFQSLLIDCLPASRRAIKIQKYEYQQVTIIDQYPLHIILLKAPFISKLMSQHCDVKHCSLGKNARSCPEAAHS
jgi:hypothetical protein